MAREQLQHVIEEANPCGDLGQAGSIDVKFDMNIGFVCLSADLGGS